MREGQKVGQVDEICCQTPSAPGAKFRCPSGTHKIIPPPHICGIEQTSLRDGRRLWATPGFENPGYQRCIAPRWGGGAARFRHPGRVRGRSPFFFLILFVAEALRDAHGAMGAIFFFPAVAATARRFVGKRK
jgi:hypothetical protein